MKYFVKKSISIFLLLLMVITSVNIVPLHTKAASKIAVSSVVVNNATTKKLTIISGKTYKLGASVVPSNATNKKLTYKSSNTDVISVNSSGKLTAHETGKATITVTAKDNSKKKVKVSVTVVEKNKFKKITKLTPSASSTEIRLGETTKIKTTFKPSNASNKNVTYNSSDKKVATVSIDGTVTAVGEGITTITVSALDGSKKSGKINITVKPIEVTEIKLNTTSMSLVVGNSQQLTATVLPDNATHKEVSYTSNNTSIATVSSEGTVTAMGEGATTITGSALDGSKKTEKIDITVTPIEVTEIRLSTTSMSLVVGNSQQLTTTVLPDNATHKEVSYVSNNTAVATVDASGNINAVSAGNGIITVTSGNVSETCQVLVSEVPSSSHTVTFQTNGGSTIASQTIVHGGLVISPSNPIRSTFVFGGWYQDSGLNNTFNFNTPISSDITIYAKWNPVTINLSIQNQDNIVTSEIKQSISGQVTTNGTISSVSYSYTSTSDSNTDIDGQAMISGNNWSIDNIKLMPDNNTFTITAVTVDGVSTTQAYHITYDSGYTYIPDAANVQILTSAPNNANSNGANDENANEVGDIESEETNISSDTLTDETLPLEASENESGEDISLEDASDSEDSSNQDSNESTKESTEGTLETTEATTIETTQEESGTISQAIEDTTGSQAMLGYVNNVIVVYFKEEVDDTAKDSFVTSIGGTKVGYLNTVNQYQIQLSATKTLEELNAYCNTLMSNNNIVKYACPDLVISEDFPVTQAIPNDPWLGNAWNENAPSGENWWQEAIDAPSAWDYSDSLSRIKVGIVDNGFATSHSDLAISFADSISASENNAENHGSHVAGIIGATANNGIGITGINWNVNMIGYDWLPSAGQSWSTESKIYEGLVKTVESGAKVINFSLGKTGSLANDTSTFSSSYYNNWGKTTSVVMESLLARGYDFVAVQSAGNGAANGLGVDALYNGFFASVTSANCYSSSTVSKEDILNRILIVGAAEQSGSGYKLTSFSNGGSQVNIAAPGKSIYSTITNGKYGYMNGTSMSAPIVSGVASLIWSVNSKFTGAEVKDIVCNYTDATAVDNTSSTKTSGSYAMVNAKLAVEEAKARGGIIKAYFSDAATGTRIVANYKIHKKTADGELYDNNTYTSDASGNITLSGLPAGTYVLEITLPGYVTNFYTLNIPIRGEVNIGTISVSKTLSENEYRIVLTWGATPSDLDSHLRSTNLANEDVHVYYANKREDEANLDVDDTTSYGPETVTISNFSNLNGVRYAVHNYTNRKATGSSIDAAKLANSDAVVKIYKGFSLLKTYNVPTNQFGTVWTVFAIDNSGNIQDINSVTYEAYPAKVLENTNSVNESNTEAAQNSTEMDNLSLEELDPPKTQD